MNLLWSRCLTLLVLALLGLTGLAAGCTDEEPKSYYGPPPADIRTTDGAVDDAGDLPSDIEEERWVAYYGPPGWF